MFMINMRYHRNVLYFFTIKILQYQIFHSCDDFQREVIRTTTVLVYHVKELSYHGSVKSLMIPRVYFSY